MRLLRGALGALALAAFASGVLAQPVDWNAAQTESVIEILTSDADGSLRETPVWIVVIDGAGYVRTNDSKWLANIRRGSAVRLRIAGAESPVEAKEEPDAALMQRVEAAFKAKYGLTQKLMSLFRMREPVVLRLTSLTS
jgi:hypothetical protein